MKTTFKINNATNKAANEKVGVVAEIKRRCGLTDEAWLNTLFDTGCQFVEAHVSRPFMADALLRKKELGFWDWWLTYYTQHDETLLEYPGAQNPKAYGMYKQGLISLWESSNQFTHFLNANRRLNGIEF